MGSSSILGLVTGGTGRGGSSGGAGLWNGLGVVKRLRSSRRVSTWTARSTRLVMSSHKQRTYYPLREAIEIRVVEGPGLPSAGCRQGLEINCVVRNGSIPLADAEDLVARLVTVLGPVEHPGHLLKEYPRGLGTRQICLPGSSSPLHSAPGELRDDVSNCSMLSGKRTGLEGEDKRALGLEGLVAAGFTIIPLGRTEAWSRSVGDGVPGWLTHGGRGIDGLWSESKLASLDGIGEVRHLVGQRLNVLHHRQHLLLLGIHRWAGWPRHGMEPVCWLHVV